LRDDLPETRLTTKLITAKARNTNNKTLPISIDMPAKLLAPKIIEIRARTKKAIAALNINTP
jgi:hypothetical protein